MVARKKLPIRWDRLARENLDDIYEYIFQDSPQNARKVKKEIINLVSSLNDFPEKYSREEFLKEVPENYRSVSKWDYKVIYEVTDDTIIIVDIFFTPVSILHESVNVLSPRKNNPTPMPRINNIIRGKR